MESATLPRIPHVFPRYPCFTRTTSFFSSLPPKISLPPLSISFAGNLLRSSSTTRLPSRFASISTGGGGDGLVGRAGLGGGGGGGDGSSGGEVESKILAEESEEVAALGPDVIVLHVGGMSCGGCAASVKRILESLPQVSSATVNLEKETAFVWTVPEVKDEQDWKQGLGAILANHLTTCGFKSDLLGKS
ncbi:uncharacterized protein [Typha angustifolia]|uniref:uncharacterized protein n=1 Tax=Typha angustifolia TaxID=59011 RepID=UPI003C30342D